MDKTTPGPYEVRIESTCSGAWPVIVLSSDPDEEIGQCGTAYVRSRRSAKLAANYGVRPDLFNKTPDHDEVMATARLFAASWDHALFTSALLRGLIRWKPFAGGAIGEVCCGGMRYSTSLDGFGIPALTSHIRAAIQKAEDTHAP